MGQFLEPGHDNKRMEAGPEANGKSNVKTASWSGGGKLVYELYDWLNNFR